ncbi:phage minor capsid protein [Furfurilactobacillus sp. WILCCON 0119]
MLDPWDLDKVAAKDSQNFADVEGLIWQHIANVLAEEQQNQADDTPPSKWQQEMLNHADDIRRYAKQVTGKPQEDAVLTLMTTLGPMSYNNVKRAEDWLRTHSHKPVAHIGDTATVAAEVAKGQKDGEKYLTIARNNMSENAYTQFNKIVTTAASDMRTGTTSTKALSKAAKQWADQGIPALIDKAGRHWSPDVYIRTVIEASVNNTTNAVELARYKQYGALVKISSHAGCRPSHLRFQDHIYSLTGDTDKYPDFESTTGYGTATGIGGIHCRHHTLPYIEGEGYMKVPQMDADENAAMYANKQTQRRLESSVRKAKRQQVAAEKLGEPADIQNAKHLVSRRQKAVREFTKDHKLTRRYDRERVLVDSNQAEIKGATLSKSELAAVNSYISSDSYKINYALRNGAEIPSEFKNTVPHLDAALLKTPKYKGQIYRSYTFWDSDDLRNYLATRKVGQKFTTRAFTSFGTSVYDPDDTVREIILNSTQAHDMRSFNAAEHEVLYERNSRFVVVDNYIDENGKPIIVLEERK